jgi:hypothetical protein
MCDAATISLVATTAGTAASVAGQKKAQRAMGEAQAAENMRQSKLRDEANATFAQSLSANSKKGRSDAELNASNKRKEAYTADLAAGKKAEVASSYGTETPKIVADESAARGAAGKMGSVIDARNKATLAGFGDATQGMAVKNARARSDIGTTADFMRGSSSALGAEMDYASHAGDKLNTIGDILSKIGMVTGVAAAAGSFATSAKDLAGAKVAESGGLLGADKTTILTGTKDAGATGVFSLKTGQWTPIAEVKDMNWGNFVPEEQLTWANKPAFLKPFATAPSSIWPTKIK